MVNTTNKRPTHVERIMNRCKYFTGIQHDVCGVGVPYASVRPKEGGGLPCFKEPMCTAECPRVNFPTREEAEKEAAADKAVWENAQSRASRGPR